MSFEIHLHAPPTGYVGLIWCSTAKAMVSLSTIEGTLQLAVTGATMLAVAAAYPHAQSTLNGTATCSSLSGTMSYETNIVGQEESGCV